MDNLFLQNKYTKIYLNIIEKRKQFPITDQYTEEHHIIPRSLNGDDSENNLIVLTAREHFICHYLLTKMVDKKTRNWYKMIKAFQYMKSYSVNNNQRYMNNRLYESCRKHFSEEQHFSQSGEKNSQYGKCWITYPETWEQKSIKKTDLASYLNNGFMKGRLNDYPKIKFKRVIEVKIPKIVNPIKIRRTHAEISEEIRKKENEKIQQEIDKQKYYESIYRYMLLNEIKSLRAYISSTNYKYSHVMLSIYLKRYVKEYADKCKQGIPFYINEKIRP
jgi:hypothetical protein